MNHWKIILYSVIFSTLLIVSFLFGIYLNVSNSVNDSEQVSFKIEKTELKDDDNDPIYRYNLYSKKLLDVAYSKVEKGKFVNSKSAIVAHHLVVADKIAQVFEDLKSQKIKTIVLISPNHFSSGISTIQTSKGSWESYYGLVRTNNSQIDSLLNLNKEIQLEESTFEKEHGISAIAPFISQSLPDVNMVPIVIDESATSETINQLAKDITSLFPDALVVASVDMSHNLTDFAADYHDAVTQLAIKTGTVSKLDLEIDSNSSLALLARINKIRGEEDWRQIHHGSSYKMGLTSDWRENTSHILGYFVSGAPAKDKFASIFFVGDIMLDRGVRLKTDEFGIEYPWENLKRFMRGSHLRVGNLEGTVNNLQSTYTFNPPFRFVFSPESVEEMNKYIDVVSLANNHASDVGNAGQIETREWLDKIGIEWYGSWGAPINRYNTEINGIKISIIGYHQFKPNEEMLVQEIKDAKKEGRFTIVTPHWGVEYNIKPDVYQRRLAEVMVDAGADLIIGTHPHVAQGIEMIRGTPVVYSLGNFIFDQQIPETWPALTLGLTIEEKRAILYLLPVDTRDSQPVPLSRKDAIPLLEKIAESSDKELKDQIILGKIINNFYGE